MRCHILWRTAHLCLTLYHIATCIHVRLGACAELESFVRRGPTLKKCFFIDEGGEDSNTTKWRFAGGPMMTQH